MALFEFKLHDIENIEPWTEYRDGKSSEPKLNWFALTDGFYYMNVGNEQLFKCSKERMFKWKIECPEIDESQVYVDYFIVRLYEDLLEILPNILQPIPNVLQSLISTNKRHAEWFNPLNDFYVNSLDEENELLVEKLYCNSTEWCDQRKLSTGHLQYSPDIFIWRHQDKIHIRWNSRTNSKDFQPWSSPHGEFQLSVESFISEVTLFHNRLMKEMKERVQLIKNNNPVPKIKIDIKALIKEHNKREKSLKIALSEKPYVKDFNEVIDALKQLNRLRKLAS